MHDLAVPAFQLGRVGIGEETRYVVDSDPGPPQQGDNASLVYLVGGVVAVSRPRVDSGRYQQTGGGVGAEHLGREPTSGGELTDAQQPVHGPSMGLSRRTESSRLIPSRRR